jgi:alkylation response protein AidB-like acyl-CoA dehydrogenase
MSGLRKVGWHASDTRDLYFDDCRVPLENQLGETGRGFANLPAHPRREAHRHQRPGGRQMFGGYGFTTEYLAGRFCQDAKILEIGEGTSEVQRTLIARDLGLPR